MVVWIPVNRQDGRPLRVDLGVGVHGQRDAVRRRHGGAGHQFLSASSGGSGGGGGGGVSRGGSRPRRRPRRAVTDGSSACSTRRSPVRIAAARAPNHVWPPGSNPASALSRRAALGGPPRT